MILSRYSITREGHAPNTFEKYEPVKIFLGVSSRVLERGELTIKICIDKYK
jgi:hypothetical protein